MSLLLQNLAQLIWTANTRAFPSTMIIPAVTFNLGALSISLNVIVTIVVAVISMVLLAFIVQKTKMGKAMRAVSEDTEAAQLMGINVNNTITYTFIIGSALAGIGSILYCCRYPIVNPTMGSLLGLKAFVAAVLGGIGSIPGAMIGGFAHWPGRGAGHFHWPVRLDGRGGVRSADRGAVIKPTDFMGASMTEKV